MTAAKYLLSREKLEALLTSLTGERPTDGEHASDDTLLEYAMELLPADELASVQGHLAACPECARPARELLDLAEPWRGQPGKERLAALSARVLGALAPVPAVAAADSIPAERLGAFLQSLSHSVSSLWVRFVNVAPRTVSMAYASTEAEVVARQSDEGTFGFFAELNPETGALEIRVDSRDSRLEGWKLVVSGGDWNRVGRFESVPGGRFGAEIVVPAADRHQVPLAKELRIAVVQEAEPER